MPTGPAKEPLVRRIRYRIHIDSFLNAILLGQLENLRPKRYVWLGTLGKELDVVEK